MRRGATAKRVSWEQPVSLDLPLEVQRIGWVLWLFVRAWTPSPKTTYSENPLALVRILGTPREQDFPGK